MKFKLCASRVIYRNFHAENIRKLENLGFRFRASEWDDDVACLVIDESVDIEIEINTLEELIEFSREWGELVVDESKIEIYNDYRE